MKARELKSYLVENVEVLVDLVNEVNCWNGELDHLCYFENDEEFFNTYFKDKPMEAVRACNYGDYNYCDEYVKFNGYGNLDSYSEYSRNEELKNYIDEILEAVENNIDNITIYDDVVSAYFEE